MTLKAGDVYLIENKEAEGAVVKKKRPVVVVSPEVLNSYNQTVMVVPLTSNTDAKPWRTRVKFQGKNGMAMCEQVMTYDKDHDAFSNPAGSLTKAEIDAIKELLRKIFN